MKDERTSPGSLQAKLKGRPKAAVTKERIAIRLSPVVAQRFRATGECWQTRMDAALKKWRKRHKVAWVKGERPMNPRFSIGSD